MQRHRHQEFIRFLNAIEVEVPVGKIVHVIFDNYRKIATSLRPRRLDARATTRQARAHEGNVTVIVVGLTGSVGMGKSTTAKMFSAVGVPVFDADATVHALYAGAAVAPVEAAFPGVARDGRIDREALGRLVIGDVVAMRRLEAIVHPLVRDARETFLDEARAAGAAMAVLDIPLLYETGGEAEVDVVVLASAPEDVQRARVLARPGMTPARFEAIRAKQLPDAEKRRRAEYIVETGNGREAAERKVRELVARLGDGARTPPASPPA